MKSLRRAQITGTGMYVPPRVVTNHDLEKLMNTSDEWIEQRSGIKERRHVDAGVTPSDLGYEAAKLALQSAKVDVNEIDLLIVATLSPEHGFPGTSSFLHAKLGMKTAPSMDIRCQCSGFLYALNVAQLFVSSGQYNRVLLVTTEVQSRALDMTDRGRDTAVLFGDGAAAVVVEPSNDPERGIMSIHLHSEGLHAEKLWMEAPSMKEECHITQKMIDEGRIYPKMDGKFVFKNAVQRLPEVIAETLQEHYLKPSDINLFLMHQANLRINEFVAKQMGIRETQMYNNIQKFGNCSAASIPICLDECVRDGRVKPNDLICLAAFGSGFTWAGALIRW